MHETPEGYLLCLGVPVARTGVQMYADGETPLDADDSGTVAVDRHEKVVFSPKTIASFEGKPVTITHPADFVSPANWNRLAKGVMQNVRRGDGEHADDLLADLLITDEVAINLVKSGLREVSCGYECDYEQLEDGKGRQLNIRGNHIALVEKGRAGSGYAIKDHETVKNPKGDTMKKTLKERIQAIFAKAQDEAMAMADEEGEKAPPKKDDEGAKDESGIDAIAKAVKDLGEKIEAMQAGKDGDEPPPKKDDKKKEDESKDDEGEAEASVEDRLSALEASVAKILEALQDDGDEEESEDADEESEDADEEETDDEEGSVVGDTASRIEILVPGFKAKGKDASAQALKAFAATKDGKKVMDSLTGGKKMTFDSAANVNAMFIAASEVVKAQRANEFGKTKSGRASDSAGATSGEMTPERINEINAKHYGK